MFLTERIQRVLLQSSGPITPTQIAARLKVERRAVMKSLSMMKVRGKVKVVAGDPAKYLLRAK